MRNGALTVLESELVTLVRENECPTMALECAVHVITNFLKQNVSSRGQASAYLPERV